MAWIGNYVYETLLGAPKQERPGQDTEDDGENFEVYGPERYRPSVDEVIAVKEALHKKSTLPFELVDSIVDMAEYWPHTTTINSQLTTIRAGRNHEDLLMLRSYPLGYLACNDDDLEQWQMHPQYAESYPTLQPKPWPESRHVPSEATEEVLKQWSLKSLPKGEHPCRKIVFTIKSHDQGWGGDRGHRGTYQGSYTWFDVGLERVAACRAGALQDHPKQTPITQFQLCPQPSETTSQESPIVCSLRTILPPTHEADNEIDLDTFDIPMLPSAMALQKNLTATRDTKEHRVTWRFDDNVVPDSLDAAELEKQGRGRDSGNGKFVRDLKVGDVITVWAKARFPQWLNVVEMVQMDVYWAV